MTTGTSSRRSWKRSRSTWTPESFSTSRQVCGWPLRGRNSRIRRVAAEWDDPIRTASPRWSAINATLRRMNARRRISLSSESDCTTFRSASGVISRSSPSSRIRPRTRVRRPVRMDDSPVNWPRSVEDRDRLLPAVDQVNDLHLARDDDVEIARGVALVEQDGSRATRLRSPHLLSRSICSADSRGNICARRSAKSFAMVFQPVRGLTTAIAGSNAKGLGVIHPFVHCRGVPRSGCGFDALDRGFTIASAMLVLRRRYDSYDDYRVFRSRFGRQPVAVPRVQIGE